MADELLTSYGKSYFNDDVTFFGKVTFGTQLTFDDDIELNVNNLVANNVSVASSITTNSVTTSVVSVASSVLVGSGVTITTSSVQVTAGIVTASTFFGNGTIPIGGIIMWSGTIANIPTGWALCNGSNGTPDLRNRFIVAAGTDTANVWGFNATTGAQTFTSSQTSVGVNSTGGRIAHQLTIAELAAHTHTYSDRTNEGTGGGTGGGGANTGTTTLNKNTGSNGSDNYHENRPPYYALAFIMRTV